MVKVSRRARGMAKMLNRTTQKQLKKAALDLAMYELITVKRAQAIQRILKC